MPVDPTEDLVKNAEFAMINDTFIVGRSWIRHFVQDQINDIWGKILGLGTGYAINGFISLREYHHEQHRLRGFFESEVAARLGKTPSKVTVDDLKQVAKKNPVMAEALRLNKTNRLVEFGTGSLGFTLAVFLTDLALAGLAQTALGTALGVTAATLVAPTLPVFAVGAVIGMPLFFIGEKICTKLGKMIFGVDEPELHHVAHNPALQSELSGHNQLRYLALLQSRIDPGNPSTFIRPDQVMSAFVAANPDIDDVIAGRYGAAFKNLNPEARLQATRELDARLGISRMTEDLNSRTVRAQEIAFAAYGEKSGVEKLDSPRVDKLEQNLEKTRGKLAMAEQKIVTLTNAAKEKTEATADAVSDKIKHCFHKQPKVSCAVPANQNMATAALDPMAMGDRTRRLIAQRRQAAMGEAAPMMQGA